MNKKFFAALASATMAFTASGSIAVFADDFVEESNVVTPGDIQQNPTKFAFNKDNFGALVDGKVTFTGDSGAVTLTKNEEYEASKFAEVKKITFASDFKGEIKGLEYFPNLKTLIASNGKVTNTTLDFSENTKLKDLTVTNAAALAGITLPNPEITKEEKEVYNLTTLDLEGTKLTKLDLSKQEGLFASDFSNIAVKGNSNLKEVTLKTATSAKPAKLSKLDLQNNALETVNLGNYTIETLNLSNNHIGALDLSKTTATTATLGDQKFYVYEKTATVNLKDAFSDLDVDYVRVAKGFDAETGVLTLKDCSSKYNYETGVKKASNTELVVTLEEANPMSRLYNPNSGEHFYTNDIKEKDALVKLGWNDEGFGWVAPTETEGKNNPVYRLYNPNAGDHHYTMKADERDILVAYGWKYENVGWYSATTDTVPVYRQYNPFANGAGSHNYTTDKAENDYLVSVGWIYEGTAWNAKR